MMTPETMFAMSDEVAKIAASSAPIRSAAQFVGRHAKKIGKNVRDVKGMGKNLQHTVRAFGTPIKAMKAGWRADNRTWQAINVGSTALDAHSAVKKEDPTGHHRSRSQRIGEAAGSFAGGLIGNPFGFTGGIAGSLIGGTVGGATGKVVNRVVRVAKPPRPTLVPGQPLVASPEGK